MKNLTVNDFEYLVPILERMRVEAGKISDEHERKRLKYQRVSNLILRVWEHMEETESINQQLGTYNQEIRELFLKAGPPEKT